VGIDVRGEGRPEIKFPGDKYWSGVSLPMMSIGYEVKMAPIQTLTLYNAVANNGRMVRPRLVKEIMFHGRTVKSFEPEIINQSICSRSTLKKVKTMLEGVVENGTANNLKNKTYKIAGKTGTAQIARKGKGYKEQGRLSYQAIWLRDLYLKRLLIRFMQKASIFMKVLMIWIWQLMGNHYCLIQRIAITKN